MLQPGTKLVETKAVNHPVNSENGRIVQIPNCPP